MNKSLSERIRAFLPAGIWGICIVFLSVTPGAVIRKLQLSDLFSYDKLGHLIFYAAFVILLSRGFFVLRKGDLRDSDITASTVFAFLVGAALEVFQSLAFIGRNFDVFDLIANIIGCATGWGCAKLLKSSRLWL